MDTTPTARVVADSTSPTGNRLTTIEVRLHRFVLAEFNTHRVLSRNSASSRAIPVHRTLAVVAADPAVPVQWPAEQTGMQGGRLLDERSADRARTVWLAARTAAMTYAAELISLGVHKSVVNRLLEPFMWTTVIASATSWDGFWDQRCSTLAQPELRVAATAMRAAYDASTPTALTRGAWHLPYLTDAEAADLGGEALKVSAARCARVSYLTHDGRRDPAADLTLYGRLVAADPPHASPLEHVATPADDLRPPVGNLTGWDQLRHRVLG